MRENIVPPKYRWLGLHRQSCCERREMNLRIRLKIYTFRELLLKTAQKLTGTERH